MGRSLDCGRLSEELTMADPEAGSWIHKGGDNPVDAPVTCVITRFGLRSAGHLLPTYLDFRKVVEQARGVATPGLLQTAFLIENSTTCYSLSLWAEQDAIPVFGTKVPAHVDAARRAMGRLAFDPDRGPELWSTKWRLVSVSNNLNWADFDLRAVVETIGHPTGLRE
jgi:hypothetical protein